jgi:hypothetical protein
MPHLREQADPTDVKPCLQCGAALDFDPRLVTARRGRLPRNHATCRRCGAVHCLLVEGGMYGVVAAGRA